MEDSNSLFRDVSRSEMNKGTVTSTTSDTTSILLLNVKKSIYMKTDPIKKVLLKDGIGEALV